MKTLNTIAGNLYTVTSPNGCTVTDERGKLKKTVKAGDQLTIMAPGAELRVDDDAADIRASNFNAAPAGSAASGGVSEEDLVTLGVLTAGEVPVEKSSTPVCAPSGDVYLVEAKGFGFVVLENPPAGCNGVAIVVGDGVNDDFLLGCQMSLECMSRGSVTLTSEPLVSVQKVEAGRRCLFYFTETIPSADQYGIRIIKNGGNELMTFLCGAAKSGYLNVNWYDSVIDWHDTMIGGSWVYPALAWEVLETEKVYGPAVDKVPTEDSAFPVSSGGVFNALAQISTEQQQTSNAYVLEIVGDMYLGDAYWSFPYYMSDGTMVSMKRLKADMSSLSELRGLIFLSEPKTASELLEELTNRTGALFGQFFVYPVSSN